jgi:hypothetical protein
MTVIVRYLAIKFGLSLGLVVALGLLEIGPRADAAYLSVSSPSTNWESLGMSDDEDSTAPLHKHELIVDLPTLYHQAPSGSTTTSPSSRTGSEYQSAGLALANEPDSAGLIIYFRNQPGLLVLSHFPTSILDPPRVI